MVWLDESLEDLLESLLGDFLLVDHLLLSRGVRGLQSRLALLLALALGRLGSTCHDALGRLNERTAVGRVGRVGDHFLGDKAVFDDLIDVLFLVVALLQLVALLDHAHGVVDAHVVADQIGRDARSLLV